MPKRLLVIDDSPSVRAIVQMTFPSSSWNVTFARSGTEGLAAASKDVSDAILIDDVLPDMRGLDVCTRLAADRRMRRQPIVLLTGLAENVRRCFEPGPSVVEYLPKPFSREELLACVSSIVGQASKGRGHPEGKTTPSSLSGDLRDWPTADLVTFVGASGRTGVLRLVARDSADFVLAYFRAGELVLVTSSDPTEHALDRAPARRTIPPDAIARAEDEQQATGKPTCVTLAEVGLLSSSVLVETLHSASRQLLKSILDTHDLQFAWHDMRALPTWVEAYGKYVPLTRNTLVYSAPKSARGADTDVPPPPSLGDLTLDRVRDVSFASRDIWPTADRVLTRCRDFSDKVRRLALSSVERRVLTLINDRVTLREIAARGTLPEDDVRRVAHVLTEIGLLTAHPSSTSLRAERRQS